MHRTRNMRAGCHADGPSLRLRLFRGLVAVLALFWIAGYGCQAMMASRQQTGAWDQSLQGVARQILGSLPANLHGADVLQPQGYELPDPPPAPDDGPGWLPRGDLVERLGYQVWSADGRLLVRSTSAPASPLKPDRADGFGHAAVDGEDWRVYALSDRQGRVQVQIGKPQQALDAELARWRWAGLGGGFVLLLLLCGTVWLIVRWSLAPADAVAASLVQRDALDLRPVADDRLPRELRPLVQSFNRLLKRLDSALEGERRFIADASHELRTPLAALLTQAQWLRASAAPGPTADALDTLVAGVQRSARLVEQLLDLARMDAADALPRRAVELHEIAALLVHDFEAAARERGQKLSLVAEPCRVQASLDALGILLRNLLENAVHHGGDGARIQVAVRCDGADEVLLEVADDGPGVAQADGGRVFDRFWRGDAPGGRRGSGLGLSLVARIAQLHGARLDSGAGLDGRGFAVRLWLPRLPDETSEPPPAQPSSPSSASLGATPYLSRGGQTR